MQAVKMADVFGIEMVWAAIYESNRKHGDFETKRSKAYTLLEYSIVSER